MSDSQLPGFRVHFNSPKMGKTEEWRILAKEAAQEKDPKRLLEIVESLARALDEQEAQRHGITRKQGAA